MTFKDLGELYDKVVEKYNTDYISDSDNIDNEKPKQSTRCASKGYSSTYSLAYYIVKCDNSRKIILTFCIDTKLGDEDKLKLLLQKNRSSLSSEDIEYILEISQLKPNYFDNFYRGYKNKNSKDDKEVRKFSKKYKGIFEAYVQGEISSYVGYYYSTKEYITKSFTLNVNLSARQCSVIGFHDNSTTDKDEDVIYYSYHFEGFEAGDLLTYIDFRSEKDNTPLHLILHTGRPSLKSLNYILGSFSGVSLLESLPIAAECFFFKVSNEDASHSLLDRAKVSSIENKDIVTDVLRHLNLTRNKFRVNAFNPNEITGAEKSKLDDLNVMVGTHLIGRFDNLDNNRLIFSVLRIDENYNSTIEHRFGGKNKLISLPNVSSSLNAQNKTLVLAILDEKILDPYIVAMIQISIGKDMMTSGHYVGITNKKRGSIISGLIGLKKVSDDPNHIGIKPKRAYNNEIEKTSNEFKILELLKKSLNKPK